MGPQCEDGYTKIANELLEALFKVRIPGESMQIFLMILRKTYGYGKKEDRIALCQFQETGISKTHIIRAISKLLEMRIIIKSGTGYNVTYGINKHHGEWQALPKKGTEYPKKGTLETYPIKGMEVPNKGNAVPNKGNESTPKRDPQKKKETYTKETIQKKIGLLPVCAAWKAFEEMRKKIKKPLTSYAADLIVKKLVEFHAKGHDPTEVLNLSVERSWQGVFEPKEMKGEFRTSVGTGQVVRSAKKGIIEANSPESEWL